MLYNTALTDDGAIVEYVTEPVRFSDEFLYTSRLFPVFAACCWEQIHSAHAMV